MKSGQIEKKGTNHFFHIRQIGTLAAALLAAGMNSCIPVPVPVNAANSMLEHTGSEVVKEALVRVGKGFDESVRFGPDYYDCSGLVYSCLKAVGIEDTAVPASSHAWKELADQMEIGSFVSFQDEEDQITYELMGKDLTVLDNPESFSVPGSILVFIEPGEEYGHTAISLGSFDRVDESFDPSCQADRIVGATQENVKKKLTDIYSLEEGVLSGNSSMTGNPKVWMNSNYLGEDMNLGSSYSGPYNSIWKVDASNPSFGVSVNNSPNGKHGTRVAAVFVPVSEQSEKNTFFETEAESEKFTMEPNGFETPNDLSVKTVENNNLISEDERTEQESLNENGIRVIRVERRDGH